MSDQPASSALYALLDQQQEQHKENRALLLEVVQRLAILETIPARLTVVEQIGADYQRNKNKAVGVVLTVTALASLSAWPTVHHLWHVLFG